MTLKAAISTSARECLHSDWLGYGNLNAPIWFLFKEEGGKEIWKYPPESARKLDEDRRLLWSLRLRLEFKQSMDFHEVWIRRFGYQRDELEKVKKGGPNVGPNVWRHIAAFILYHRGTIEGKTKVERKNAINEFLKDFGALNATFFMCEFLPLPRVKESTLLPEYCGRRSVKEYEDATQMRFDKIKSTLKTKNVRIVVSFDDKFSRMLDCYKENTEFSNMHKIVLNDRFFFLLTLPFPIRRGYDDYPEAVERINKFVPDLKL